MGKIKPRYPGGVGEVFRRHHADVVCLQEVKMPHKSLPKTQPDHHVAGFESFW